MRTLMIGLAAVLGLTAFAAGTPAVGHAASNAVDLCQAAGTVGFTPAPGITPGTVTYRLALSFSGCQSASSAPTTATATGTGTGSLSCLSGTSSATLDVTYADGRTSTVSVAFTSAAGFWAGLGAVTSGVYAGAQAGTLLQVSNECSGFVANDPVSGTFVIAGG
jgi:hypothetical protein